MGQHVFYSDVTEALKEANDKMQGKHIYNLQDVMIALKTQGDVSEQSIETAKAMDSDERESIFKSMSKDELDSLQQETLLKLGDRSYLESEVAGREIDYKVQWYDNNGKQEITIKPANFDIEGNKKKDGSDKANFYQNGIQKTIDEIKQQMLRNSVRNILNAPKAISQELKKAVDRAVQEFGR